MSSQNKTPVKFRPERPIYLNEDNLGVKTRDQVLYAIQQLRDHGWLCAYNEIARPFHQAFNSETELSEFKKCADKLGINLKSVPVKTEEIESLEIAESTAGNVKSYESNESSEDPDGKIHIE